MNVRLDQGTDCRIAVSEYHRKPSTPNEKLATNTHKISGVFNIY